MPDRAALESTKYLSYQLHEMSEKYANNVYVRTMGQLQLHVECQLMGKYRLELISPGKTLPHSQILAKLGMSAR